MDVTYAFQVNNYTLTRKIQFNLRVIFISKFYHKISYTLKATKFNYETVCHM